MISHNNEEAVDERKEQEETAWIEAEMETEKKKRLELVKLQMLSQSMSNLIANVKDATQTAPKTGKKYNGTLPAPVTAIAPAPPKIKKVGSNLTTKPPKPTTVPSTTSLPVTSNDKPKKPSTTTSNTAKKPDKKK